MAFCAVERTSAGIAVGGEDEQEQRAIVMQGEAPDHPPRLAVHHVDVRVARPIAGDLERRDAIAEMLFELMLRSERQRANGRMQAIRADHQIEPALAAVLELTRTPSTCCSGRQSRCRR